MNGQKVPSVKSVALAALLWTSALLVLAGAAALRATSVMDVVGLGLICGFSLAGSIAFARYAFRDPGEARAEEPSPEELIELAYNRNRSSSAGVS